METSSALTDRASDFMRALLAPRMRMTAAVLIAVIVTIAAANGGCSNSTANPGPTPTPSASASVSPSPSGPLPSPTAPPQNFVSMSYAVATPTVDPTYGQIDGYGLLSAAPTASPLTTPAPSQVIMVTHGQTIVFINYDKNVHTASLLTPQAGGFPSTFNNVNGASQSSPELTAITASQFSTGSLAGGSTVEPTFSKLYTTGSVTGVFFFGDFYNYQLNPSMRGVIIIQ